MRPNAERILNESSNREEEDKLLDRSEELHSQYSSPEDDFWFSKELKEIKEKVEALKNIDQEQALALNDELDRLVENLRGKEGEDLNKALEELKEFKNRLNTKVNTK